MLISSLLLYKHSKAYLINQILISSTLKFIILTYILGLKKVRELNGFYVFFSHNTSTLNKFILSKLTNFFNFISCFYYIKIKF